MGQCGRCSRLLLRACVPAWCVCIFLLVVGCDRDAQIRVYSVPKQQQASAPTPSSPQQLPELPIRWTLPAGWTRAADRPMSVATFTVAAGDPQTLLTVTPLGHEALALLPNVNRWEGQLGLPLSNESDLSKVSRKLQTESAGEVTIVDLKSPQASMLAAIVPHADRVWFLKLMGTPATVNAQREQFEAFVKSVVFDQTPENSRGSASAESGSAAMEVDGARWSCAGVVEARSTEADARCLVSHGR